MDRSLAALAALLVGGALWITKGMYHPVALAMVTAGAAAAVASLRWRLPAGLARPLLSLGVAASLLGHALSYDMPAFVALAAIGAVVAASYLAPRPVRGRFWLLLACLAGMGALIVFANPPQPIDVMMFQHYGGLALLHRVNPYELVFPNIYGSLPFYGPGMLVNGKVVVFPYPPLTAELDALSLWLGHDVRWQFLAAMLLAGVCIGRLGKGPEAQLAAAFAVLQPTTFHVLGLGWTEPTVLAAWAATLFFARRRPGVPAGFLLAAKQYTPLFLFPLFFVFPRKGRTAAIAAAVASATALPFAAWNFHELWRDVVIAQFLQPLRTDALSWLAAVARWTGYQLPSALGFLAAAAVLWLGLRNKERTLERAAGTAAASFLAFLLFNKQAFCNYYWLAAGLCASAAAIDPSPQGG